MFYFFLAFACFATTHQVVVALPRESACAICRYVVDQMITEVYHRKDPHTKVSAHAILDAITHLPIPPVAPNLPTRITSAEVQEFVVTLSRERKYDKLLRDLVRHPPSQRKLSMHAIREIFRKALCIDTTAVCEKQDEQREL